MSKEELIKRLVEILPDNADIIFATVTWWDNDGCHNYDATSNEVT